MGKAVDEEPLATIDVGVGVDVGVGDGDGVEVGIGVTVGAGVEVDDTVFLMRAGGWDDVVEEEIAASCICVAMAFLVT
jgi:hypothetical protein